MAKLTRRLFLILTISCIIHQFNVNSQSTIGGTSGQQISNSTLSYTSQASINTNQTLLSLLTTALTSSNTNTMITTGVTRLPFSITITHHTRFPFSFARNMSRSSLTTIIEPTSVITTRATSATITSTQPYSSTPSHFATKCERYITLLISVHFLLFIFPIH